MFFKTCKSFHYFGGFLTMLIVSIFQTFARFLINTLCRSGTRSSTGRVQNISMDGNYAPPLSKSRPFSKSIFCRFSTLSNDNYVCTRTAAMPPLTNIDGCKCTRCTRSGVTPAVNRNLNSHLFLSAI